jgi:hypothetical protein
MFILIEPPSTASVWAVINRVQDHVPIGGAAIRGT